jgi:hypothetical protein
MAVAGGGPTSERLAVSKLVHPPHFSYRDSDPMELLPSGIRNQSGGRSVLGGFFVPGCIRSSRPCSLLDITVRFRTLPARQSRAPGTCRLQSDAHRKVSHSTWDPCTAHRWLPNQLVGIMRDVQQPLTAQTGTRNFPCCGQEEIESECVA